jgi:hypothetical protein
MQEYYHEAKTETYRTIQERNLEQPSTQLIEKPRLRESLKAVAKTVWVNPELRKKLVLRTALFVGTFAASKYGFEPLIAVKPPYDTSVNGNVFERGMLDGVIASIVTLFGPFNVNVFRASKEEKIKRRAKPGIKYSYTVPGSIIEAYSTGKVQPPIQHVLIRGQMRQRPSHI